MILSHSAADVLYCLQAFAGKYRPVRGPCLVISICPYFLILDTFQLYVKWFIKMKTVELSKYLGIAKESPLWRTGSFTETDRDQICNTFMCLMLSLPLVQFGLFSALSTFKRVDLTIYRWKQVQLKYMKITFKMNMKLPIQVPLTSLRLQSIQSILYGNMNKIANLF